MSEVAAVPAMATAGWLGILALHDARTRRMPNRVMAVAYASVLALLLLSALLGVGTWAGLILRAVLGAVLVGVGLFAGRMGGGDIKAFGLMGLGLGALSLPALASAEVLAGAYVAWRAWRRHVPWREPIPLGPFLFLGTLACLVLVAPRLQGVGVW